jgi:hypothetical protein
MPIYVDVNVFDIFTLPIQTQEQLTQCFNRNPQPKRLRRFLMSERSFTCLQIIN